MSSVRLLFLGRPFIERDGEPAQLTSAKAVALLAFLALNDTPQLRDTLLGLLWAESTQEAARKNLRNTLWNIRRLLGEGVLVAEDDRLAIGSAAWMDVRQFAAFIEDYQTGNSPAEAALELYRGPLLEGLNLHEAPEFEIWLAAERVRLARARLHLLAEDIDRNQAAGRWSKVIQLARHALAQDDLQEPMYRVLMEAHARLGDRAEALRQYQTLRDVLAAELSVAPLPETEALRDAIAGGNLPPGSIHGRQPRSLTAGAVRAVPFVGRRGEMELLDSELRLAASGQARAVMLIGELGIGKSSLWREWSAGLHSAAVLQCGCVQATQALPFAPLVELFRGAVAELDLLGPASPVPPVCLAEVARLAPEIRAARPDLPPPASLTAQEERRWVLEAFSQTLLAVEVMPLVIFIDDLHWADRATLDWLGYLLHRGRDRPLLVVGAYRPEDASATLHNLAAAWEHAAALRRITLGRLTGAEAETLIQSLVADPQQRAALLSRALGQSAGNPYFMIEICRAGPGEDAPVALVELVRARLDRLPETTRQVLQAAAVLEPEFDFDLLRAVSGRDEIETLDALDGLLEAAVLVERGAAYAFAHPLVAAIVRNGLSGARRAFLNRRSGRALETAHAGRLPLVAGRLTEFYANAGDSSRAARFAEMAGERALSLAALDEAIQSFRQALELEATPARRLGLGRALYRKGQPEAARPLLEAALAAFQAAGDSAGAAQVQVVLADINLRMGRFAEIIEWAKDDWAEFETAAQPAVLAMAHHIIGAAYRHARLAQAEAGRHFAEAARLAERHGLPEVAARARFALGNTLAERGDLDGAIKTFRETIPLTRAAGDIFHEVLAHNNLAYHAALQGDLATAHEYIAAGITLAEKHRYTMLNQWLFSTRGEIALTEELWGEAETWLRRGLAEAERYENGEMASTCRANLGRAARGRGELTAALALLQGAAAGTPSPQLLTKIDLWTAEVCVELGDVQGAARALARAEARLQTEERSGLRQWAAQVRERLA